MAVTTTKTNKPINPRGNDQSPKGYNRAALYSGKALDFDGVNDIVATDYTTGFTGAQEFTYCAYIKADTNQQTQAIIHANEVTGWGLQSLQIRTETNGVRFFAGTGSQSTSYVDSEAIETGKWYFVVGTHTPTENKIYINGVLNATSTADNLTTAPGQIYLGLYAPGWVNPYDGQISNAKVFDVALTAAQVSDLYNNPEKIVPTGVEDTALKLWLPMMEGAGTTAYDGSGNGNHGTISGATWTHGVGAPVAQSAVMDWNKGVNLTNYSEDGTQWSKVNTITITQDQSDPFGGTRAQRFTMDAGGTYSQAYKEHSLITGSTQYTAKMWLKAVSGTPTIGINYNQGTWHQVTLTNEWAEYEVTRTMGSDYSFSHNIMIGTPAPGTSSTADFYIYGLQIQLGDTAGPYVPTFGTAQTTPVLLPQGLTSGRDITGVNLFENVRKQGALNLDGNSWAEVHDNASLDITTAISVECWIYYDGSNGKGLLGRWSSGADSNYLLYTSTSSIGQFYINTTAPSNINTPTLTAGNWYHIVGTYDGSDMRIYLNGSESSNTSKTGSISTSSNDIEIGRFSLNSTYAYSDQIAQPRIYNRALTAEEVERNYNAGKNIYK